MDRNANANNEMDTDMRIFILAIATLTAIVGCTSAPIQETEDAYAKAEAQIDKVMKAREAAASALSTPASTRVNSDFFGSKSMPFKQDVVLPRAFRVPTVFNFPNERFTLAQAAAKISALTGIPIRISQDVYGKGDTAQQVNPQVPVIAGGRPIFPFPGAGNQSTDLLNSITLYGEATPASMLDQICRLTGLTWEYKDGVAVIQRFVTRTFVLKVQPGSKQFDVDTGKTGSSSAQSGSGSISTGFTAAAQIHFKSTAISAMNSAMESVKAVLSPVGKAVSSLSSGTITVIDTIDGIQRAADIIERENEILSRNALFHVRVYSFKENGKDQVGVDWNVIFRNLNKLGAGYLSPSSLVSNSAGQISTQLLTGTGSNGRFDGTQAFLKLLNEFGKVTTVYNSYVPTRNRSVTPVSAVGQIGYLAKTTPAPAAIGGTSGGVPGLEPGVINTGFDMQIQPNIFDSNQMSVLFALGLVDLVDIKTISSGTGVNQTTIETPETRAFQNLVEIPLVSGETALITGYEHMVNSYTQRKLGRDAPMLAGGSFNGSSTGERIFILITPLVVGSVY